MYVIGASKNFIEEVEKEKTDALSKMTSDTSVSPVENSESNIQEKLPVDAKIEPIGDLSNALFKQGEVVALRSNPSKKFPIMEVIGDSETTRYRVWEGDSTAEYFEDQLQPFEVEEKFLGADELRAILTSLHILSSSTDSLFSLNSGRIEFVPYQYRPVLKLIKSDRPRLLIADEVGVGKTIEAGLIIKELRARMDLSSVLIICPKPLVAEKKWLQEMKRFDEDFVQLDGESFRHCIRETDLDEEWPNASAKAILPFSLLGNDALFGKKGQRGSAEKDGLLGLDTPPKFDLVIVDEAHNIRNPDTMLHQGVRFFCDNAQAVVFLSATPVQLGQGDLFTLLNVLRPDIAIDVPTFEQMAEPNKYINSAIEIVRGAKEGWQEEAKTEFDKITTTAWGQISLCPTPDFQSISDQFEDDNIEIDQRVRLIRDLEELYTFSGLINRTRRRDIGEFTTRNPETLRVDFTESQRELHDDLLGVIARILSTCHGQQNVKFMMTTIRRQAASCLYGLAPLLEGILEGQADQLEFMAASESDSDLDFNSIDEIRGDITDLLERANGLDDQDPKVDAFLKAVLDKTNQPKNKVLVFSTFRHTLSYLENKLRSAGARVALITGTVKDDERSTLRKRFKLPKENEEAIDVMLSSEVGSEGLDFQFCDYLVNYDLPWNPMRIEQRIGRIDRYGQESDSVVILNLVTPGTVDADIYDRCLDRIGVFQHAIGGNEDILGSISEKLRSIAESFELTPEQRRENLQQVADNEIRNIQEKESFEESEASLFGINVPKDSWENEVESAKNYWLMPDAIQKCVSVYLKDKLGEDIDHIQGVGKVKKLRIDKDSRSKILEDYEAYKQSQKKPVGKVGRTWEKWLKSDDANLQITFDQDSAVDESTAVLLSTTHPLVRQSAIYWEPKTQKTVSVSASDDQLPPGDYHFSIYRWKVKGVKQDEELVVTAEDPELEKRLLKVLQKIDISEGKALSEKSIHSIDGKHHQKWAARRGNHLEENELIVEQRENSLKVSHEGRRRILQGQIESSKDSRIKLMKESELSRAQLDYERRLEKLKDDVKSGDILASRVVVGVLTVR